MKIIYEVEASGPESWITGVNIGIVLLVAIGAAAVGIKLRELSASKLNERFTSVITSQNLDSDIMNLYYDDNDILRSSQIKEVTDFIDSTANLETYDINETPLEDYWDNF